MRGLRVAGVGLGVACGAAGWAAEPAARFGVPTPDLTVRGQAPTTPPAPGGALSPPRPVPQGPTISEQRTVPPPVVFGTPVPIGGPVTYLGVPPPPTVGMPPAVGPVVAPPDMDSPLLGGPAARTGPLGILTGGNGFNGPPRLRLDADFLLWFVHSADAPPLLVTGQLDGNNLLVPGTTANLFGGDNLGRTLHTGARFGGTYWLDDSSRWGLDGSLFFLARRGYSESFVSGGSPVLARPFINANQGIPFAEIVAAPGLASGSMAVTGDTHVWGADANLRRHLWGGCDWRVDGLLGYRYLNVGESLTINESAVRLPNAPPTFGNPDVLGGTVFDRFRTENHFHGVNLGLAGELRRGRWFAEARVAVALGTVFQTAIAEGSQQATTTAGVVNATGGLLAIPGNLGSYSQRKFGVVPEAGLKLGYHITDRWRVNVGYNFLYLNSVLRPGDQIDPALDITRIPNFPQPGPVPALASPRPVPLLKDTGIFVQGISFGVQWAF